MKLALPPMSLRVKATATMLVIIAMTLTMAAGAVIVQVRHHIAAN